MSDLIRILLASVEASTITDIFCALMMFLFIFAVISKCTNRFLEYLDYAPSLLTSLGILGTFTGIVIGLFDFSIANIDSSITILLDGLKTAFITSILGITLSLILKLFCQCYQPARFAIADITMEHLYNSLNQQLLATESLAATVKNNQDQFLESQRELTNAAREHQHEFVENQRKLADENREIELKNQEDFLKNQESYLEKLDGSVAQFAREGVQSLVVEMNEVVKNFNQHVQIEFGENFKAFGQRLDQFGGIIRSLGDEFAQHEERIQYWTEHCDANVVSLVRVRNELEDVSALISNMPDFVERFGTIIENGHVQLSALSKTIESYGDINERIDQALPSISEKLSQYSESTATMEKLLTEDIKQALNNYQESLVTAQEAAISPITVWQNQLDTSLSKLHGSYDQSIATMTTQTQTLEKQVNLISEALTNMSSLDDNLIETLVTQTIAAHRSSMQDLAVNQAKTHHEMTQSLTQLIQKNHAQSERSFSRQIDNIENHLEREIEDVMRTMGEALAMISGQFTRDYHSLIQQMQGLLAHHKALEE